MPLQIHGIDERGQVTDHEIEGWCCGIAMQKVALSLARNPCATNMLFTAEARDGGREITVLLVDFVHVKC